MWIAVSIILTIAVGETRVSLFCVSVDKASGRVLEAFTGVMLLLLVEYQ